jgi:hypothetical protein
MGCLSERIKENERSIRSILHIGYAVWNDLLTRVEIQETDPKQDFYDEQIWTFLVGCAYGLANAGATRLANALIGAEASANCTKIWFESLPNSPRVKEGKTRVDLAVGAIRLRSGTKSGIEFDTEAGAWVALCECKWYSDIDTKVSYDLHRNQLLRTIENGVFFQSTGSFPERVHVVLVTPASFKQRTIKSRLYQYKFEEYASNPQVMIDELKASRLHYSAAYPENLNERLGSLKLHWVTYQELLNGAPSSAIQEPLREFIALSDRSHEHC